MAGLRSTFNWMQAPDEGDAAAASAEIASWLRRRSGPARDWTGVLTRLRDELARLCVTPLIVNDGECRRILTGLADNAEMADVVAALDALDRRVDVLLALRGAAPVRPPEPGTTRPAQAQGTGERPRLRSRLLL